MSILLEQGQTVALADEGPSRRLFTRPEQTPSRDEEYFFRPRRNGSGGLQLAGWLER